MNQNPLPFPNPLMLPLPLQNVLSNELNQDETLLWLDQPIASRMAKGAWPLLIFGVFWSLFCGGWMTFTTMMALSTQSSQMGLFVWLFPAFGLPFCAIGLALLTSPIWMRKLAGKMVYAVTDKRALILSRFIGKTKVRSYTPDQLNKIERTPNDDGSGDLIFEKVYSSHTSHHTSRTSIGHGGHGAIGHRTSRTNSVTTYGFKCVANVKQIHDLIDSLVASSQVHDLV